MLKIYQCLGEKNPPAQGRGQGVEPDLRGGDGAAPFTEWAWGANACVSFADWAVRWVLLFQEWEVARHMALSMALWAGDESHGFLS